MQESVIFFLLLMAGGLSPPASFGKRKTGELETKKFIERFMKMKKIVLFAVVLSGVLFAEVTLEQRRDALQLRMKELPAKKAELKTKTYSGTFGEILDQRIADINVVTAEAKGIVADANVLGVDAKIPDPPLKETVVKIEKVVDANEVIKKEQNNQFLKAVNDMANDPCIVDPCEIAKMQELVEWVVDVMTTEKELGGL